MKRIYNLNESMLSLTLSISAAYLIMLSCLDYILLQNPVFQLSFYTVCIPVDLLMILLFRYKKPAKTGTIISIILFTVLPLILSEILENPPQISGDLGRTEFILLRILPLLLLGLILIVYKFGIPTALIYNLIIFSVFLIQNRDRNLSGMHGLRPFGFIMFIYIITFTIVSIFIYILLQQLKEKNRRLLELAGTREDLAISRERNRIARELHDTLSHSLSALSIQLETAKAYIDVDIDSTKAIIENSLTVTREGLDETRGALKALRSTPLEENGLIHALKSMLNELNRQRTINIETSIPDNIPIISSTIENTIYRITGEAVTNAVNHSNCRCIEVELIINKNIRLSIKDDGDGFTIPPEGFPGHYGLTGMKERAELAGGSLNITSKLGNGCKIEFLIKENQ